MNRSKRKKIIAGLTLILTVTLLASCGNNKQDAVDNSGYIGGNDTYTLENSLVCKTPEKFDLEDMNLSSDTSLPYSSITYSQIVGEKDGSSVEKYITVTTGNIKEGEFPEDGYSEIKKKGKKLVSDIGDFYYIEKKLFDGSYLVGVSKNNDQTTYVQYTVANYNEHGEEETATITTEDIDCFAKYLRSLKTL